MSTDTRSEQPDNDSIALGRTKSLRSIDERRAADRERKNRENAAARVLWIPRPEDLVRRHELESDLFEWLRWYLPDVFTDPFRPYHIEMGNAILNATIYAGDQAFAAPRGEGKTTLAEGALTFCILKGVLDFVVLFAATANDARNSLAAIKESIAESDRLLVDYPEVCVPVREVGGTPSKAHSMIISAADVTMVGASFQWSGDEITMPRVPGSVCAGSIIATRGLDSAVRGLKKFTRRPQLALIDDPDTEDTARSEEQAKKLETRIDRAIAGLAPRGKRMSRVMLTTLQNRTCVSARFTDPTQKPSWQGKRFKFVRKPPDKVDQWDEYVALRQRSMIDGDPYARVAHNFYLERREAMDAGAELSNPLGFDGRKLSDGSQLQASALQRYYDFVADNGIEAALSELQNDPPEDSSFVESGITPNTIMTKLSGYPRRIVPPGCVVVTQGIDVHKTALHWVVRAWRPDASGYTIDRGVQDVHHTIVGSDEGVEIALVQALRARREEIDAEPYATVDGEIREIDATLVDAGWQTQAIYHACNQLGFGWMPAMGFGKSRGCAKTNFSDQVHTSADRKPGDGWFLSRRPKGVWLVCCDTDRWKRWEHDRWMTPEGRPGCMSIFGEPVKERDFRRMTDGQREILAYAHHIVAEVEREDPVKGVIVRKWVAKSNNNHWLDASYLSDVAANLKGISLLKTDDGKMARKAAVVAAGGWMGPVKGKNTK